MSRTATTEGGKKAFMSIINGKWAEKAEAGTEGAVERKNKKEEIVHELLYNDVSGIITSMVIEKKDFGKQLNVVIDDVGEVFTLSIPVESRYFDAFVNKIACADLKKPVRLAPFSFIPSGETKAKSGMNIYQVGNPKAIADVKKGQEGKLPYFFTKEAPNGRPQPMKDGQPLAEGEQLEEEEWKAYFLQVSLFNQRVVERLAVKFLGAEAPAPAKKEDELPTASATPAPAKAPAKKKAAPAPVAPPAPAMDDLPF